MNETAKPSIATNIYAAALAGLLLFSTYQIGRVGAEAVVVLSKSRAAKNAR